MNAKNIIEFINDYQNGNMYALDALKRQAMAELEASTAKCPQLIKARQAYAAKLKKEQKQRPALAGAFTLDDGKQYLCDGYMLVRYSDVLDNIEKVEDVPLMDGLKKLCDDISQNNGDKLQFTKKHLLEKCAAALVDFKAKGFTKNNRPPLFKIGIDYPAYIDVNLFKTCISLLDENGNGITLITSTRKCGSLYLQGKDSELPIGRASLVEYDGNNLTLYNAGYRDLNDNERKVMNEWQEHCKTKEYKQKENIDKNIDTSMSYWDKLAFLEKRNMEHLMGTDKKCGLIYIARLNKVQDDSLKGDICMKYEIRKTEETKTI